MKRFILLLLLAAFIVGSRRPETLAGVAISNNAVDVDGVVYAVDSDLMVNETYILTVSGGRVLKCIDLEIYELEKMENNN